jgi:pyruvate,water dikinase
MKNTSAYILEFHETDRTNLAIVGGKGSNLGELSKIKGVQVPSGFCITTKAYAEIVGNHEEFNSLVSHLETRTIDSRDDIRDISSRIRTVIENVEIPDIIDTAVVTQLQKLGIEDAYAIRSSATAEDLPNASFAGQQDTYLNIIGKQAIIKHIGKCWASLFTDRAVTYRIQNRFDHRKVQLSVVIQKMIFPKVSGILFTADPVTGNRKMSSIDAGFGLGEALVSGLVNPDIYKVYDGTIAYKKIATKKLAVYAVNDGGTHDQEIDPTLQNIQALTDDQILQLERLGRKIERHFGSPQDIEWCMADDTFHIVQSRPITTLYPVPELNDGENHVYVSTGHQQMMTDAMKPLGLSMWQMMAPRPMLPAGGRLFVDLTEELSSPAKKNLVVNVLGKQDPLIRDALTTLLLRGDFIRSLPEEAPTSTNGGAPAGPAPNFQAMLENDPEIVTDLVNKSAASIEELKRNIQLQAGPPLFDFIREDILRLRKFTADPRSFGAVMTSMNAATWINEKMIEWLGVENAADALVQSAPNNVTSEMGLALLDVADVIRPYPRVIDYLQHLKNDDFLDGLSALDGGRESRDAIYTYLEKNGMRCSGEIDISKTRWSEKPAMLVPVLLGHMKNFEAGAGKRKFEQGLQQAAKTEQQLLQRLKTLPDGEKKAEETKRMIDLLRTYSGFREYPKYAIVNHYWIYKQALLKEAKRLVEAGVIDKKEDIYYLTFEELREVVGTFKVDQGLISRRMEEHATYEKLSPPRVITSDGEIITGRYNQEDLPANAIAGLGVSSGTVEGRARVILNMEEADLEEGDILVTAFTDPSWTPLFVSIKGLVTEVGGLMTHGAVIAREYGLPAVVGVEHATKLIKDGQRIRVHGGAGYVEILSQSEDKPS